MFPLLESIVCLDEEKISKTSYSTGETVGGSWTDKVLNVKDEKEKGSHLTEDSKAIDDDEWVRLEIFILHVCTLEVFYVLCTKFVAFD